MQNALYNMAIHCYGLIIRMAGMFNVKARKWTEGRKEWQKTINPIPIGKVIWMHCASLGEFEQGRPLLEKIKQEHPDVKVVLTFFSPSGYEVRKNYPLAEAVYYLPLDTPENARHFIQRIRPSVVLFVKYEFWYNYLSELRRNNIPTILFSAIFREEQVFFRWYGGFFRKMLSLFNHIFVQTDHSLKLLQRIGIPSSIACDTRFDRVFQIASQQKEIPEVTAWVGGSTCLVAGSTWPKDEVLLSDFMRAHPQLKFIVAPHDVSSERLSSLRKQFPLSHTTLTDLLKGNSPPSQILLIDTVGHLALLYRHAKIAYVGGGFDHSIHNILEPLVYNVPVFGGGNISRSAEAMALKGNGFYPVRNYNELQQHINSFLTDEVLLTSTTQKIAEYMQKNCGGTDTVYTRLKQEQIL